MIFCKNYRPARTICLLIADFSKNCPSLGRISLRFPIPILLHSNVSEVAGCSPVPNAYDYITNCSLAFVLSHIAPSWGKISFRYASFEMFLSSLPFCRNWSFSLSMNTTKIWHGQTVTWQLLKILRSIVLLYIFASWSTDLITTDFIIIALDILKNG